MRLEPTPRTEPVPTIQSPASALARMRGLQVARVRTPPYGLGAKPESCTMTYENRAVMNALPRKVYCAEAHAVPILKRVRHLDEQLLAGRNQPTTDNARRRRAGK